MKRTRFTKEEIVETLTLLGYQVISVRKKIINFQNKPNQADILMFVKVCADMLEEKMSYGEILTFIINDTKNKILRESLREISKDLKQGVDSEQAFLKHKKSPAQRAGLFSNRAWGKALFFYLLKLIQFGQEFVSLCVAQRHITILDNNLLTLLGQNQFNEFTFQWSQRLVRRFVYINVKEAA